MKTGIIIPIYNLWKEMTLPCLVSIKECTDLSHVYIYTIDNASQDVSSSEILQTGKNIFGAHFQYLRNDENKGFAIACNQGAQLAKEQGCGALFFLNNDTKVTKNWLPPLLKELENPEIGLVGPLLLYPDNTVQHCGIIYDLNGYIGHIYSKFPYNHPVIKKHACNKAITAAALLARTEEFFNLGKFCEEYINGFEDVDLCFQYEKAGYSCKVVQESIVYHYESKTQGRMNAERGRHNRALLFERNKDLTPYAHIYYEEDGYLPALTNDYFFYVRLNEENAKIKMQKIQSAYSDKLCMEMLREEPYWHEGYFLLFDSLYKQQRYEEALACCNTALSFRYFFDEMYDRQMECYKKILKSTEVQEIVNEFAVLKDIRRKSKLKNQERLKLIDDEKWRKQFYLTRKLPIFDNE